MEQHFRAEMGKRLQQKRTSMNLTQENVAEKLNVSVKHYGCVERGVAGLSLENLVALSDILDLNLNYLIRGDDTVIDTFSLPTRMVEIYSHSSAAKRLRIMEILEAVDGI